MICEQCHKENRSVAKFCKWCGHPLISLNVLDRMVGLDEVKKQLEIIPVKTVEELLTVCGIREEPPVLRAV